LDNVGNTVIEDLAMSEGASHSVFNTAQEDASGIDGGKAHEESQPAHEVDVDSRAEGRARGSSSSSSTADWIARGSSKVDGKVSDVNRAKARDTDTGEEDSGDKQSVDGDIGTAESLRNSTSSADVEAPRGLNLKLNLDQIATAGAALANLIERERWSALPTIRTPKGQFVYLY
jgi:hypothetical protein